MPSPQEYNMLWGTLSKMNSVYGENLDNKITVDTEEVLRKKIERLEIENETYRNLLERWLRPQHIILPQPMPQPCTPIWYYDPANTPFY